MATLTIQVGQCGNQLGQAFFDTILGETEESSPYITERAISTYFQRDINGNKLTPNAVLVDMEPKVVQKCLAGSYSTKGEKAIKWSYDPSAAFYK